MPETSAKYVSEKTKGKLTPVLPVPTVFIVDTTGKILFEYINIDIKTRLNKDLLLAAIHSVKHLKP